MNILSQASAMNPGSSLWIVPDFSASKWTQKLDWYLNFQMIRSSRHLSPELRNFTVYVQRETGIDTFDNSPSKNQPLMILSEPFFPNNWVVMVPMADNFNQWVRNVSDIWENLKNPTLRIFLPTGQSASSFEKAWHKHHSFDDFTVVLD